MFALDPPLHFVASGRRFTSRQLQTFASQPPGLFDNSRLPPHSSAQLMRITLKVRRPLGPFQVRCISDNTAFVDVGITPACVKRASVVRDVISLGSPDASITA